MKNKIEEWNPKNLFSLTNITKTIENLCHFSFKLSNSNAFSGGLVAEKVDLDGYVCMSSIMKGNEFDLMHNPSAQAKIFKRIDAVIEGKENELFTNINQNDVIFIRKKIAEINSKQSLNLGTTNKRLKQIIIQEKLDNEKIKNRELIILRSSGFAKILSKHLQEENKLNNELFYSRKKAQMSFGGAKPINIGTSGYLMSNVLYFDAPKKNYSHCDNDFNEAYKIHHSGLKLYDLVHKDFLNKYFSYQEEYKNKNRVNSYFKHKEKDLIVDLFFYMKKTILNKYELLEKNRDNFPNKQLFSDELFNSGNDERLIAFSLIGKNIIQNSDEKLINWLVAILKTKTFFKNKEAINLILSEENILNIKKYFRELLWENI